MQGFPEHFVARIHLYTDTRVKLEKKEQKISFFKKQCDGNIRTHRSSLLRSGYLTCLQQTFISQECLWLKTFFNPFAPEPPVRIQVLSTLCDVISFDGQGQLCPLTCAEWRDLSNHTRMSTIQSRTPEKEAKNLENLVPLPTHLDQKAMKCTTCKPVCGKF